MLKKKNILKKRITEKIKKTINIFSLKKRTIPKTCGLFMTDRCNFKCRGCRRGILNVTDSKEMELNTVKKLLSLYPSIKSFTVAGFGEPTLCEEFVEIVKFLKENGKKVYIITNGTNIGKILQLNCKAKQISVSLYGYDTNSYIAYTGVNAYNRVIENFLQLKGKLENVGFSYILTKSNYRNLDKIIALCDKLQPDFLHLINYLAYDYNNIEEVQKIITVKDTQIINYIDEMCAGKDYIKIKPVYIDFENPKFNCNSYDYVVNLDGEGNVGGCMRQIPPDSSFGNIFKESGPFNSTEMKRLRRLQHTMARTKKPPHKECHYCFGNWYPK